jgi:hypothetical protein
VTHYLEISLEKSRVSCVARLLEVEAPVTCRRVLAMLPVSGVAWHAKYTGHEIYFLTPPGPDPLPGRENSTIIPLPGDVGFLSFPREEITPSQLDEAGVDDPRRIDDFAVFYGPNNNLFNPALGYLPANIFARVVENLEGFAIACHVLYRHGAAGEVMSISSRD